MKYAVRVLFVVAAATVLSACESLPSSSFDSTDRDYVPSQYDGRALGLAGQWRDEMNDSDASIERMASHYQFVH